jgi:hypothetical protein
MKYGRILVSILDGVGNPKRKDGGGWLLLVKSWVIINLYDKCYHNHPTIPPDYPHFD